MQWWFSRTGDQPAAPSSAPDVHTELNEQFGAGTFTQQATADGVPTLWVPKAQIRLVLHYLKLAAPQPYRMLFDLTAIDERARLNRLGQPASDFTVVYQLLSHERNQYLRLKVALAGEQLVLPTITDIWPMANWYEREVWDMLGIRFAWHPHLRRLLMPQTWEGHPLHAGDDQFDFEAPTAEGGDCNARALVRVEEMRTRARALSSRV